MQTTTTSSFSSPAPSSPRALSLDTLATLSGDQLEGLYRTATISSSMRSVDGELVGRMLEVRGIPPAIRSRVRRWAASPAFVWEGKTFSASDDARGVGHNRVYIPGVLGRQNLFPFETLFAPSAIDGKPTLVLNYDLRVNPGYIRKVHDEIREVSPGLFLGPAMWKRGSEKSVVLWFALESRLS